MDGKTTFFILSSSHSTHHTRPSKLLTILLDMYKVFQQLMLIEVEADSTRVYVASVRMSFEFISSHNCQSTLSSDKMYETACVCHSFRLRFTQHTTSTLSWNIYILTICQFYFYHQTNISNFPFSLQLKYIPYYLWANRTCYHIEMVCREGLI